MNNPKILTPADSLRINSDVGELETVLCNTLLLLIYSENPCM